MIGKIIRGYFQGLQDNFNKFGIVFDTFYNPLLDDYKQAMTSYNLRQMYKFDSVAALKLPENIIESFRTDSYNCMSYKYSPLRKNPLISNNTFWFITYEKGSSKPIIQKDGRKFLELPVGTEQLIERQFVEYQKSLPITDSERVMQSNIDKTLSGKIEPQETGKSNKISRLGFDGELDLEVRFLTTNTKTFEEFQILYNLFLAKRNKPEYVILKEFGDEIPYPITTKYEDLSSAQQVESDRLGNLMEISFSVTISAFFLSSFVQRASFVNSVDVFFEARYSGGNKSFKKETK